MDQTHPSSKPPMAWIVETEHSVFLTHSPDVAKKHEAKKTSIVTEYKCVWELRK